MNPIFRREFFARWRDWRSHLLLFGLALLLSLAAYWTYRLALETVPMSSTGYPPQPIEESLATRASRAGHALFSSLAVGNVAVWFVLAPLLCATGVARERERGLLEGLQLSPMSPRSQVWSRAASAMLYLLALQLVTLPIYFVAFSFGGVSPMEIARAWLLVGAAAWCGVGLGLMLSAASHRPSGALFGVVALLCGWTFVAFLGWQGASSPFGFLGLASGTSASPLAFCELLFYAHPMSVVAQLLFPTTLRPPTMSGPLTAYVAKLANGQKVTNYYATPYTPVFWTPLQVLPFALAGWFLVGSGALAKAARDVTRAFEPSGWAGRNPLVEAWKKRRASQLEERRARASARTRVEGALLADLPFDKWIRFADPLLNREVKSRFRLRRTTVPMWFLRGALFLGAASAWVMAASALFDPRGRDAGAPLVLWTEWILGAALVGTWAASSFAREREAGTWEGVRLSLLPNWQIARTKWASPPIAFALLTLPLWALLPAFVPFGTGSGTPLRVLLASAAAVAGSLCFVSALGSWVSLRARNTTTATCWTLGLLLAIFVAAPVAWQSLGADDLCVRLVTGVPAFVIRDAARPYYMEGGWRNLPNVQGRYKAETGRDAPDLIGSNGSDHIYTSPEQGKLYEAWCQTKQEQAALVSSMSCAWSPLAVLGEFPGNQREKGSHTLSDNHYVEMALGHAAFCAACVALLLGSATRRLRRLT